MTTTFAKLALSSGLALAVGLGAAFSAAPASAKGKEYFSEVYRFNKPHDGYSGFSGNYYCDYQKKPVIECTTSRSGRRVCAKKGWELRQHCY